MCVRWSFSGDFAAGHIKLMGRQVLPILMSLPSFMIGIIIALCHTSCICPVEIDRLKMLVR